MPTLDRQTVTTARTDVSVFAQALVGQPLWPHQAELARSNARIRCICSGRQAGKSTTLAITALHDAYRAPNRHVLVISAGEAAALDLLGEVSRLASGPLLTGSVIDDQRHQVVLTNGSTIRSVPASEKQIRGKSVHLLIIDEACFVSEEVWQAARFTVIARPESRVIMASTPWGRGDRFFALAYRAGQRHEEGYESFHWPSTASPLVDPALLDLWRASSTEREFQREVEALWTDAAGAYFSEAEIEAAVCDYELVPPERAKGRRVVAGCDWGFVHDSSALVLLAEARRRDLPGDWPRRTFYLPWIDEGVHVPYAVFVKRVVEATKGYRIARLATETNGVGSMPSQELKRLAGRDAGRIVEVSTTAATKEDAFGRLKVLLSQGRLALPRHPRLLAQLSALEYEERDSGTVRIEVPERAGHDDLVMALCLATGVGDVASRPAIAAFHVAAGMLPTAPIGRRMRLPEHESAVPTIKEGEPRPVEALLRFANARRHRDYQGRAW